MRQIEIQLIDTSDNYLGNLELENFKDFPLSLTKGIGDINSLTKRQAVYSLDFEIPVTANNNKLLFGVAYVNASGDTLKPLNRNKARIIVDGNQIEQGFIRIIEHTINDTYKANFTGGNGDWVNLLANTYLNELEWVAESNSGTVNATETFSSARINVVNALDNDNSDIVYPHIERNVISPEDVQYLRPMLYVRSVVNRMFEKIGYTVAGTWIDSDEVQGTGATHKGLVLDPAFRFVNDDDTVQTSRAYVTTTESTFLVANSLGNDGAGGTTLISKFSGFYDDEIADLGSNWTPATSIYTASASGSYSFVFTSGSFRYQWDKNDTGFFSTYTGNTEGLAPSITYFLVKNNTSPTVIDGTVVYTSPDFDANAPFRNFGEIVSLQAGDELTLWTRINDDASGWTGAFTHLNAPSLDNWRFFPALDSFIEVKILSTIELGQPYTINAQIKENVSCLDVLQDLKVMYNLYFATDFGTKEVTIEARDDYYQNIGSAKNITDMVDISKAMVINSEKSYKKEMRFRYAEDSNDGYLKRWQAINNRTYGEYTHDFGDNYEQGVDVVETKLISPTIQKVIQPANLVTSVIRREWEDDKEPTSINQEYNIRVFYCIQGQQFEEDGTARRPQSVTIAMMESFANVSTLSSNQLTFNGSNGLFARYYAKTIANIEDLRKVELYLKMPLFEFQQLDLSRPVYIDFSIPQLQGYYIIEQVNNYKLESYEPVKVRLLRFKNYQAVTVDTTQKTNINENTADGQGDDLEPIYYVFDEGTTDENYEIVYDIENNNGALQPLYYE